MVAHGGDKPDATRITRYMPGFGCLVCLAVWETDGIESTCEVRRGGGDVPSSREDLERVVSGFNNCLHLGIREHFLLTPLVAFKRHILNEAYIQRLRLCQLDKVKKFIIVHALHNHAIDLRLTVRVAVGLTWTWNWEMIENLYTFHSETQRQVNGLPDLRITFAPCNGFEAFGLNGFELGLWFSVSVRLHLGYN